MMDPNIVNKKKTKIEIGIQNIAGFGDQTQIEIQILGLVWYCYVMLLGVMMQFAGVKIIFDN